MPSCLHASAHLCLPPPPSTITHTSAVQVSANAVGNVTLVDGSRFLCPNGSTFLDTYQGTYGQVCEGVPVLCPVPVFAIPRR